MAAHGNLRKKAQRLLKERRWAAALELYGQLCQLQPQDHDVWLELGLLQQRLDDPVRAEQSLRRALELRPNLLPAYAALATLLFGQGRLHEAETLCRTALALAPQAEEIAALLEQVRQQRGMVTTATRYEEQQRYPEALTALEEALRLNPQAYEARWRYAELLLLLGRYQEGWAAYEWRLQDPRWIAAMGRCEFAAPRWQGEPLDGKTILVYAEQGFGDTLQFSRYLPLLHQRGARIIFYCDRELLPLYQQAPYLMRVEAKSYHKALTETVDYHAALMSLPHGCGTTLEKIPAETPYLYICDERRAQWQQRIGGAGFKVGLVWAGRETHANNQRRSCGLAALAPLAGVKGVQFYSLQKGAAALDAASQPAGMVIEDLAPQLNDFSDTAAAIEQLDLVIAVDTAVAHLAGTLGKPVWILNYFPPEWRWLLGRDDSPWYPTMRLFRQSATDADWSPVVERVAQALSHVAAR